ncbi:MAG: hypothetical protein KGI60_00060 [Patescibacteria group bacterium]|nr:hypothetical protein [Patescibacteria group bacterium]
MKYGDLTLGKAEAIVNKLGGMEGVKRFLAGELELVEAAKPAFPTWRTVKLGTGLKTATDFRSALMMHGYEVSVYANNLLDKVAVANQEIDVNLVDVSAAELGFPRGATRAEIYRRAHKRGLELCPAEVGPQLRLQYPDQPDNEWRLIAMKPLNGSGRDFSTFVVTRIGPNRWLNDFLIDPARVWNAAARLVFVRH